MHARDRSSPPRVFLEPAAAEVLGEAVLDGGGQLVPRAEDAEAFVWSSKDVAGLEARLHPGVSWVQLPDAGVEKWLRAGLITGDRVYTSARGCYGPQVAEHALTLLLSAARRVPTCVRLDRWPGVRPDVQSLREAVIAVVGAGDIGSRLIELLDLLGARTLAVTRSGTGVPGATESLSIEALPQVLPRADFVVLAAPSTPLTRQMIGREQLRAMKSQAWLVNVGRGDLVDTDALVHALTRREIAGAALDVTDPEPLPDGHPLWRMEQVLITPHVANPPAAKAASLAARVRDNVRRFAAGLPLHGVVDAEHGF